MVEHSHHETNMKREKKIIYEFEDKAVNVLNQYINWERKKKTPMIEINLIVHHKTVIDRYREKYCIITEGD